MPFDALARLQRNARRVGEILAVLAKYGLADWLRWLDVDWIQDRLRSPTGERLRELRLEARIRLVLIELGTTFIKLGQVLSTRPDLVGPELAEELTGLQANTVPDPAEVARQTIEADLGKPPEELFATFEGEAFASASIAQVHGATLKTGERVVVKVRRQGVAERAEADLEILHALARLAENHAPSLRQYQPAALVRQFQRTLRRELDFTHERRNLEEFARRFASDPTVHFPAVHASLSGRTVLTMERLEGIPAADGEGLRASGADLNEFARRGAEMYLEMIFRDSVYHADP
ncbi:MAG TPA: AarF/UbiB family protein, partial [Planctomycetota bacterium]|nr:AarF/UbiB family protein [Planctomycetota bacterium]